MTSIVGVDFGGPRREDDQRRKIVAIAAQQLDWRRYRIDSSGFNDRLLRAQAPGWTADELTRELIARPAKVVGFDFPFSVPRVLLRDEKFARVAGYADGAFRSWRWFNAFVASKLRLRDPLDFSAFDAWREKSERRRLWVKRQTDVVSGGQPPLKDKFQCTFQMTLLGNAVLSRLVDSGRYAVLPFPGPRRDPNDIIEVYPRATLRAMGLLNYKSRPDEAIRLAIAACHAAGISLEVEAAVAAFCCRYSSGGKTPDYDGADAFVALCTAILYREGECRRASGPDSTMDDDEGVIWVPKYDVRELR